MFQTRERVMPVKNMHRERRIVGGPQWRTHIRSDGSKNRILTGYAAVFYDGTPETQYELWNDSYGRAVERIMPGAFDAAMGKPDDVRALWNHDPNWILGRTSAQTLRLTVDRRGLLYEIDLPNTQMARDIEEHVRRGDVTGSSFSFEIRPGGDKWRTAQDEESNYYDVREILSVELFDVGPVTFPAYVGTSAGMRALGSVAQLRSTLGHSRDRHRMARYIEVMAEIAELEVI